LTAAQAEAMLLNFFDELKRRIPASK